MSELHQDCRFLDYDEGRYAGSGCILMKEPGGYWWWKRPEHYPGAPVAVQFCQRYGRINQRVIAGDRDLSPVLSHRRAICHESR